MYYDCLVPYKNYFIPMLAIYLLAFLFGQHVPYKVRAGPFPLFSLLYSLPSVLCLFKLFWRASSMKYADKHAGELAARDSHTHCRVCQPRKTYSIVDLACACKHLYYRLTPLLFRTLRFSAHNISQLAEDVQQTRQILQRVDGYSHVRRLIIDDKVRGPVKPNEARFRSGEQAQQTWRRPIMSTAEFSNHFDDFLVRCMTNLYKRGDDIMSLQVVYDTNDSWEPLADFIRQISFLEGLFYDCLHQIPPCILECLHQNQPQCRLYINQFKLRSLDAHGTDNYEYSLASSPCLYGLTILRHGLRTSFPTRWYDDEALECIVGGLAPNLKRLHMMRTRRRGTKIRREQTTPWAGFAQQTPESKITHSRGALFLAIRLAMVGKRGPGEVGKHYGFFGIKNVENEY